MFDPQEQAVVSAWQQGLDESEMRLDALLTADRRSAQIEAFCDGLVRLAPSLRLAKEKGNDEEPPRISIARNITYLAVPLGKELEPFLAALSGAQIPGREPPSSLPDGLERIRMPAELRVFITPPCPFCAQMVARLLPLALANGLVRITVIDGELFPEIAAESQVRSVPTVTLDEELRWTGLTQTSEILGLLLDRDPQRLGPDSLKGMIEEGNAEGLARMMVERGKIFPAFVELLAHSKWPVRLGAMATFEFLADMDRALALRVVDPLWRRFDQAEDAVKGDILHVLGTTADPALVPRLKAVAAGPHSQEVREAAGEIIEELLREGAGE